MSESRHTHEIIRVECTAEEQELLERAAAGEGLTLGEWVRRTVLLAVRESGTRGAGKKSGP